MNGAMGARPLLAAVALTLLLCAGCVRGCTSSRPPIVLQRNMYVQPKYRPQAESRFFYDGAAMRPPVPGTVARGELREDDAFYLGKDAAGRFAAQSPVAATPELLARGAERYGIYCAPCHDPRGNGRGILFQRGGVPTASFHQDRLRAMPDGQLFDVITNGQGLMPSYRFQVAVADRWAIVAYVRDLQQRHGTAPAPAAPAQP